MSKKKIVIIMIIGIIVFAVLARGTIGLNGCFYFTNDLYPSAEKAIEATISPSSGIDLKETIDLINITDNIAIYLGLTADDTLFLGELFVKNGQFSFLGNYHMYSNDNAGDYAEDVGIAFTRATLYNAAGIKEGAYEYAILLQGAGEDVLPDDVEVKCYADVKVFSQISLVYKTVAE